MIIKLNKVDNATFESLLEHISNRFGNARRVIDTQTTNKDYKYVEGIGEMLIDFDPKDDVIVLTRIENKNSPILKGMYEDNDVLILDIGESRYGK